MGCSAFGHQVYRYIGGSLLISGVVNIVWVILWGNYALQVKIDGVFITGIAVFLGVCGMILGNYIQKLYSISVTDPLTNTGNRRYLYYRLSLELRKLKRSKHALSLAFIDVDNFKTINDTKGHHIGDQVLMQIGAVIKHHIGQQAGVVRWGGDEFILIFPQTDVHAAKAIIDRLRYQMGVDPLLHGITISVGLIEAITGKQIEDLLNEVDFYLQKAKKCKNTVRVSDNNADMQVGFQCRAK